MKLYIVVVRGMCFRQLLVALEVCQGKYVSSQVDMDQCSARSIYIFTFIT